MLGTIMIGRHSSVQGDIVSLLPDGRLVVRVGGNKFAGQPVRAPMVPPAELRQGEATA